jgi:hypothetical protein
MAATRQQNEEPFLGAELVAGPPAASPPIFVALLIVAMSIIGPFLFLSTGSPSLLFGITAVALALAGMITMVAALRAATRRRADLTPRRRVSISSAGVTLHPTSYFDDDLHFAWEHIASTQLTSAAFFLHTHPIAPRPGRYAVRFGRLITPRSEIVAALGQLQAGPLRE